MINRFRPRFGRAFRWRITGHHEDSCKFARNVAGHFLWNRDNVVSYIDRYTKALGELKQLIKAGDAAGIEKSLERAKGEREKLNSSAPSHS